MRPTSFEQFIGQKRAVTQLSIAVRAAQDRQQNNPDEILGHTLLQGPRGLGKTTLAKLAAAAFGRRCIDTTGQTLTSPSELTAILCSLQHGDMLFIDEIHRLPKEAQEALYRAMEDGYASITVGKPPDTKILPVPLQPFTLIGATTRTGLLARPFLDRFTHQIQLEFYEIKDLARIIEGVESGLGLSMAPEARTLLASLSRGTPRIALQLLKKLRDFAQLSGLEEVNEDIVTQAMQVLNIGPLGLNGNEIAILEALVYKFDGGPTGLAVLAAMLGQETDSVEEHEEFLLRLGMIDRTTRGRVATAAAYEYLGAQKGLRRAS